VIYLNDFEKEYLKKCKENHPDMFEVMMFLIEKINKSNEDMRKIISKSNDDMKKIMYLLISLVLPVYLVLFQFIFQK